MRPIHFIIAAVIAAGSFTPAIAQYERQIAPFPVVDDRGTVPFPFWGGINYPKPLLVDFDHDSRFDMFTSDPWGKLAYFHNEGSAAQPYWVPVTDRFAGIDIGTWFTLCDIDADNDVDLFCDNRLGGVQYWNNQTVGNAINFVRTDSVYGDTATGGFQTGINNTGAFADIDGDNDFDFFFGGLGGNLVFYRNTGTPQSAVFAFITELYDSVVAFPQGAPPFFENPNHGFSNIAFADPDTDGDQDLFFGDIYNLNIYLFSNLGTPALSQLKWTTQDYLTAPTAGFNHPTFADLDADNDLDLVIGVAQGESRYNLRMYANLGTPQSASFIGVDSAIIHTLDFGTSAMPAQGDLDGDGDLDMLIGAEDGTLSYFQNTGTIFDPTFTYQTNYLNNIHAGFSTAPALGDMDGDGDLDLLVGNLSGQIQYWNNTGNRMTFSPQLITTKLADIKVDQLATPRLVDLNNDSLVDLVVGEWDFNGFANILLYQNTGTRQSPGFTLINPTLLKRVHRDVTIPQLIDWDGDGKLDLVVGARNPEATVYKNTAPPGQFPDSNTLILLTDTVPGYTDGGRLSYLFGDIDADGDLDIFSGEDDGGLNFYRHTGSCCIGYLGNVDGSADGIIDISDLTVLIDGLFISLDPFACPVATNVDGSTDGAVDISDITRLIAFLFISFEPPSPCP